MSFRSTVSSPNAPTSPGVKNLFPSDVFGGLYHAVVTPVVPFGSRPPDHHLYTMKKGKKTYQLNANNPSSNPTSFPIKVSQKLIISFGSNLVTMSIGKPTTTVNPSPELNSLVELIPTLSRS